MKKGKESKNIIFDRFIKKVSEFNKSNFDKSFNDDNYKYDENNFDYPNVNHKHLIEENNNNFIQHSSKKNKNANKVFNYNNNIPWNKREKKEEKEENLNYTNNFQTKKDFSKNKNFYTNPFRNTKDNNLINNINNKYKQIYYNDEDNENDLKFKFNFHPRNEVNDINTKKDNKFQKNLENSKNEEKVNLNHENQKNMNIYNLDLNEEKEEGDRFIYILIGILGAYSAFIYLYKNKELRASLMKKITKINFKKILDYIKVLVNKIKSFNFNIDDLKKIFNNAIDFLNKIFNEYNDVINLIGIIIIINLFWFAVKLIYRFVMNYLEGNQEEQDEEENDIECELAK